MNQEKDKHNNSWAWIVVILIITGLFFMSYFKRNQSYQYQESHRIVKARRNCRQNGHEQGWDSRTIATCDKLGDDGYTDMVNYYYNMY